MSSVVHIHPEARASLRELEIYTTIRYSPAQAERYLDGLRHKLTLLAQYPGMAPVFSRTTGVRAAVYQQHRILYRPTEGGIEVLRIVHQAQDI